MGFAKMRLEKWEKVTTRFHQAFEGWPQEEAEADFSEALDEVRRMASRVNKYESQRKSES